MWLSLFRDPLPKKAFDGLENFKTQIVGDPRKKNLFFFCRNFLRILVNFSHILSNLVGDLKFSHFWRFSKIYIFSKSAKQGFFFRLARTLATGIFFEIKKFDDRIMSKIAEFSKFSKIFPLMEPFKDSVLIQTEGVPNRPNLIFNRF